MAKKEKQASKKVKVQLFKVLTVPKKDPLLKKAFAGEARVFVRNLVALYQKHPKQMGAKEMVKALYELVPWAYEYGPWLKAVQAVDESSKAIDFLRDVNNNAQWGYENSAVLKNDNEPHIVGTIKRDKVEKLIDFMVKLRGGACSSVQYVGHRGMPDEIEEYLWGAINVTSNEVILPKVNFPAWEAFTGKSVKGKPFEPELSVVRLVAAFPGLAEMIAHCAKVGLVDRSAIEEKLSEALDELPEGFTWEKKGRKWLLVSGADEDESGSDSSDADAAPEADESDDGESDDSSEGSKKKKGKKDDEDESGEDEESDASGEDEDSDGSDADDDEDSDGSDKDEDESGEDSDASDKDESGEDEDSDGSDKDEDESGEDEDSDGSDSDGSDEDESGEDEDSDGSDSDDESGEDEDSDGSDSDDESGEDEDSDGSDSDDESEKPKRGRKQTKKPAKKPAKRPAKRPAKKPAKRPAKKPLKKKRGGR